MKIVKRTQDRLVLRYRDWISLSLLGGLTAVFWGCALIVLLRFDAEWVSFVTLLGMPAITAILFLRSYCDVSADLDRNADVIRITRRTLRRTLIEQHALSDITDIRTQTMFDNNVGYVLIGLKDGKQIVKLPALRQWMVWRYDGTINALEQDLRDWIGLPG